MKQNELSTICTIASLISIVVGFALLLAALGPERTSNWGEVATKCIPQAMLIVGGLIALAICSTSNR